MQPHHGHFGCTIYYHLSNLCSARQRRARGDDKKTFFVFVERSFKIRFCYFFSRPLTPSVQTVNTLTCLCKTKRNMPNLGTNVVVLKLECGHTDIACSCALMSVNWSVHCEQFLLIFFRLKQKKKKYFMFVGFKTIHACN